MELAHITITGDRAEDMEAQLRFMADQDVDLIITSGGLGPTADDMTVEVVARFAEPAARCSTRRSRSASRTSCAA